MLSALFGLILGNELCKYPPFGCQLEPSRMTPSPSAVLLMTFVIGLLKYRSLRSPLIKIFYRDGFFYFFMLSGALKY